MNKKMIGLGAAALFAISGCKGEGTADIDNAKVSTPPLLNQPLETVAPTDQAKKDQEAPVESAAGAITNKSSGATSVNRRFKALLDTENSVITSAGLSAAKIAPLIKSDKFSNFVQRLQMESARDPLAQDVTAAERSKLERQLRGGAPLREFACGLSVCAGTIAIGNNVGLYDQISKEFLESGPDGGSLLDYRVDLGNGDFEQRFVMSVDPDIQGIVSPLRP